MFEGLRRQLYYGRPAHLARLISWCVPRRMWFSVVSRLDRVPWLLTFPAFEEAHRLHEVLRRDLILHELTHLRGAFPIRYRVEGADHVRDALGHGKGLLYCGLHLPGFDMAPRALHDMGAAPQLIVAAGMMQHPDQTYQILATSYRTPAVEAGVGALLRIRSAMRMKQRAWIMLDVFTGDPLRPDAIRLAGKVGSPVLLCWSEWPRGGSPIVYFALPEHPICDTEEKVFAALAQIDAANQGVLRTLRMREGSGSKRSTGT